MGADARPGSPGKHGQPGLSARERDERGTRNAPNAFHVAFMRRSDGVSEEALLR
jgi:hypothetical protein